MEDKKDILESLAGVAQLKHDNVIKDDAIENIAQYDDSAVSVPSVAV